MLQENDDDFGVGRYASLTLLENSDIYHLSRRHADVSPTDLVDALGRRFAWDHTNTNTVINAYIHRLKCRLCSRISFFIPRNTNMTWYPTQDDREGAVDWGTSRHRRPADTMLCMFLNICQRLDSLVAADDVTDDVRSTA